MARYYAKFFRRECQKYAGLHVQLDFMPCYAYRPILGEDEGEMDGFCGRRGSSLRGAKVVRSMWQVSS